MGVNPTIAGLASAFVSGGILNSLSGTTLQLSAQSFLVGGLKGLAQSGAQTLLTQVGLDPALSQTLSLITSPLIDGVRVGNVGGELVKIVPNLAQSLSFYGVEKLGASLGLDSRVSTLIGTPISAGIGAQLQGGVNVGTNIINAINDGIVRGAVSLGISYATQSISNPLLASLTARAVTGTIDGALGGNVFQGIYKAFTQSALNVARLGISGDDPWSQAQYLQRVINFSTIIQQKGLAQAIDDSATQILTEDSINSILKSYSSVKNFIQDAINQNNFQRIQVGSSFFRRLTLSNGDSITATDNYTDLTRIQKGSEIIDATYGGSFGKVDDTFGAIAADHQATIGDQFNSYTLFEKIKNGQQSYAEIKDSTGKTVLIIEPSGNDHYNVYNSYGDYVDAKISRPVDNKEYQISSGMLDSYHVLNAAGSQVVWGMDLVGGLYIKTYQNLNLTSNEQSLTQPQKTTLDQMMQDIQSVVQPIPVSADSKTLTYAGPLSGVADKINSIDNPVVTAGLKQSAINALNNWLASNPGVIPDVKVVIRKTVVSEFDLLSLHYEHDNETTSTFKGNNDRITLKVDPFSGNLFEVGLDGTVRLVDNQSMNIDVGINTNINQNLISSSVDLLYQMDSKYNGNKIATTTTSLSYDPTGKTEFSYESGGTFSSDLEVQNNTVIKVSAPTRNLLLATAGAFSGALLAAEIPAATAVAAGTLAQVYQAIRTAMANGALGIS